MSSEVNYFENLRSSLTVTVPSHQSHIYTDGSYRGGLESIFPQQERIKHPALSKWYYFLMEVLYICAGENSLCAAASVNTLEYCDLQQIREIIYKETSEVGPWSGLGEG